MIESDKLEFLSGEVNGLRTVLMALMSSHPEPRALVQELDRLTVQQTAVSNPMPVTEQYIRGETQTTDTFRARILELLARGSRR
jgi:hypothetical protein